MLARLIIVVTGLLMLSGCARATLPYKPEPQPPGARISAAYQVIADQLRIEIDTDGRFLEQAWIVKPDGTALAPHAVEAPPIVADAGPNISIGIGGGTWGSRGGVGTGVGVGIPVGGGTSRVRGNTTVAFGFEPAGPPPWRLYVKLAGLAPTTFLVGAPPPP